MLPAAGKYCYAMRRGSDTVTITEEAAAFSQQQQQHGGRGAITALPDPPAQKLTASGVARQRVLPVRVLRKVFRVPEKSQRQWPLLRGKVHLLLLYLVPLWGWLLFREVRNWRGAVSATVAIICQTLNFGASALLHNVRWTPEQMETVSKIDYAMIFVMISGSCAPINMLFAGPLQYLHLCCQWGSCFWGIGMIVIGGVKFRGPRALTFVFIGLLNLAFIKYVYQVLTILEFSSLMLMATSYIVGAFVYAARWPDPWPETFGYHEIMHTSCLIALFFTLLIDVSVLRRLT